MDARTYYYLYILWGLRSEGISFRNEKISTEAQFHDWESRYNDWRNDVLNAARNVDINLHNWLERLDRTVSNPGNMTHFNGDHELLCRITSTILDRLQKYLKKDLI